MAFSSLFGRRMTGGFEMIDTRSWFGSVSTVLMVVMGTRGEEEDEDKDEETAGGEKGEEEEVWGDDEEGAVYGGRCGTAGMAGNGGLILLDGLGAVVGMDLTKMEEADLPGNGAVFSWADFGFSEEGSLRSRSRGWESKISSKGDRLTEVFGKSATVDDSLAEDVVSNDEGGLANVFNVVTELKEPGTDVTEKCFVPVSSAGDFLLFGEDLNTGGI